MKAKIITLSLFILIILLSYFNLIRVSYKELISFNKNCDFLCEHFIDKYEKRYIEVKKYLPAREKIGYISDKEFNWLDEIEVNKYFLTQYALIPVLVDNNYNYKFVLGNFHKNINPKRLQKSNLIPVKDFGKGIVLFMNKDLVEKN